MEHPQRARRNEGVAAASPWAFRVLALAVVAFLADCHPAPPPRLGPSLAPGDARVAISFEDRTGSSFELTSVELSLDGQVLFQCAALDEERLEMTSAALVSFDRLQAGRRELVARLRYRGNGYGVFSYLRGYSFAVQNDYLISLSDGDDQSLHVVAREGGDETTPLEDRLAIGFEPGPLDPSALPPQLECRPLPARQPSGE